MTKEQTSLEEMTLGQIFKSIAKLRYKTIASVIAAFVAVFSASFALGRYSYQQSSAVLLESPFAMRITLDNQQHDFNSLTLIRDPSLPTMSEDKITLSLREVKSAFDVAQVGIVVAKVEKSELSNVWSIFSLNLMPSVSNIAYAQPAGFNWHGHDQDFNFTEKFIDQNTVNRNYVDGCILEYKVDDNRRSVPDSFKWIKSKH
jgi:hypothetical protein